LVGGRNRVILHSLFGKYQSLWCLLSIGKHNPLYWSKKSGNGAHLSLAQGAFMRMTGNTTLIITQALRVQLKNTDVKVFELASPGAGVPSSKFSAISLLAGDRACPEIGCS
jgi:hypothetical protein